MCMYQKEVLSELKTKHIQIFSSISIKRTTEKLAVSQMKAMITQHISMVLPVRYTCAHSYHTASGIQAYMYVNRSNGYTAWYSTYMYL